MIGRNSAVGQQASGAKYRTRVYRISQSSDESSVDRLIDDLGDDEPSGPVSPAFCRFGIARATKLSYAVRPSFFEMLMRTVVKIGLYRAGLDDLDLDAEFLYFVLQRPSEKPSSAHFDA